MIIAVNLIQDTVLIVYNQKRKIMPKTKVWLVIEKNVYGESQSFSVVKKIIKI